MKPRFSASEVASLLGWNPYKSKNETLVKVLSMMPKFKPIILGVKEGLGARTDREVVAQASPSVLKAMYESVDIAVASTSDSQMEKAINIFKKTHIQQVIQETLEGKRIPVSEDVKAAVQRISTGESTLEAETVRQEVVASIQKTQEHQVLASEIQKRRGIRLEDKAENTHAAETGKDVTDRNTFVEFECPEYRLIGYLDGMQDGKVVETKNRKRFWATPPAYDFVQLRCYMFMKGKKDGLLLENFPGKPPRTTSVPWDDRMWQEIHDGLCDVSRTIQNITDEGARDLAHTVFSAVV